MSDESEEDMDALIRMEEREREQQQRAAHSASAPAHLTSLPSCSSPPPPASSSSIDLPLPSLEPADSGGGFIAASSSHSDEKYPDDDHPASSSPSRKRHFESLSDDELNDDDLAELDAHIASHTSQPPSTATSPPPSTSSSSPMLTCQDCGNLAYNVPYYKAFHLPLCNACQSHNPPLYSLITKSTARTQHLLTDADFEGLPFLLRPNPTRGSFANMKLYRLCEVKRVADGRWGGEEGVEEEKRRREKERMDREVEKRKRNRVEIDKERRVRAYRVDLGDKGHRHTYVDDKKTGKQRCKECGFTLAYEEL